jgi:branched-chain amino acid transport system permease protein
MSAPAKGQRGSGKAEPLAVLALVALVVAVPLVGSGYHRAMLVLIGVDVLAVAGLALLVGYAGLLSLAQGAFFGLGAYGFGILSVKLGWAPPLALVAVLPALASLAYLVGLPLLRLSGHFFALGTLAFAIIVLVLFLQLGDWTGGPSGLAGLPRPWGTTTPPLNAEVTYCYLVWLIVALGLLAYRRTSRSEVGMALRAVSATEVGAAAVGLDIMRLKLAVFVVAALYAGLGGALYGGYLQFISPAGFDVLLPIQFVVMVMVGGAGSYWGPLLGASLITLLVQAIRGIMPLVMPNARGEVELIGLGVLLGAIMLLLPGGLASLWLRPRGRST